MRIEWFYLLFKMAAVQHEQRCGNHSASSIRINRQERIGCVENPAELRPESLAGAGLRFEKLDEFLGFLNRPHRLFQSRIALLVSTQQSTLVSMAHRGPTAMINGATAGQVMRARLAEAKIALAGKQHVQAELTSERDLVSHQQSAIKPTPIAAEPAR